jgi:hypothetical protein
MSRAQKLLEQFRSSIYQPHLMRIGNSPFGGTEYKYETVINGEPYKFVGILKKVTLEIFFTAGRRERVQQMKYRNREDISQDTRTMITAMGIVKDFVHDIMREMGEYVHIVKFSAVMSEPARVRIYDKFAQQIAAKYGGGTATISRRFNRDEGLVEFLVKLPPPMYRDYI